LKKTRDLITYRELWLNQLISKEEIKKIAVEDEFI
jgi:hypothetical protein